MIIAFNKPYGALSQFTPDGSSNRPLSDFKFPKHVYPLGRLDADSEGLLLLSDEAGLNKKLLDPTHGHPRTYWAQVDRVPTAEALAQLNAGVRLSDYQARPCVAKVLDPQPNMPDRSPPIRFRKNVPTCWISLTLTEGKNRQVRRMTAAVGFPTLRLIRTQIGAFHLGTLPVGVWRFLTEEEGKRALARTR